MIHERRRLGQSELEIPPVMFGAWAIGGWFWGGTEDETAVAAIHRALDLGMVCIDTAPVYGFGHSEEIVGRAIQGRRDQAIVATKCGLRWDTEQGEPFFETRDLQGRSRAVVRNLRRDSIMAECDRSLQRLGLETIDLYQCHWPDATVPLEEPAEAMDRLHDQGKIRAVGVSNFDVAQMTRFGELYQLHSAQPRYSLLQREIEADVLPWCRANEVAVLAYSPLQQGLLTGKVTPDRTFAQGDFRPTRPWFAPEAVERVNAALQDIQPIADAAGATLAQLAIGWLIGEPGVTAAIVGARNADQVAENADAAQVTLSAEQRARIRERFEAVELP